MPAVQRQFEDFHSAICFDEDDEKATLREKRDTIVKALKANLGDDVPTFTNFNQGSYSMHTGVVPLDGNFDIDVGLIFDVQPDKTRPGKLPRQGINDGAVVPAGAAPLGTQADHPSVGIGIWGSGDRRTGLRGHREETLQINGTPQRRSRL